jgi:outer membrane protein assembly factor BamB
MHVHIVPLSILVSLLTPSFGGNWPQWRGPNLNGFSEEQSLPTNWSTAENIVWKTPLPEWSGATPIVWQNRIFLNIASGDQLALWCLDRETGEILWRSSIGGGNVKMRKQNMSSPSPVTDGTRVWALTGTGVLKAFDFEGKELWVRRLQEDYGPFGLNWGYASSPLLYKDRLVIQVLHGMKTDEPSYVMAINKEDGSTLWRVTRPTDAIRESPDSYTTPALLNYGSRKEIVISGGDYVTGHDFSSGEELWRAAGLNPQKRRANRMVASPTVNEDMIYVPSRRNPLLAFRARSTGSSVPELLWLTEDGPDVPSPVSDGKYLYVVDDKGIMWCRDAFSGKEYWGPERLQPGTYSASPVVADGKVYATSEDGVTSVVAAGPEFKLLAVNDLGGYTLSSPAVSDGQIFIRTDTHLYCIAERASAQ